MRKLIFSLITALSLLALTRPVQAAVTDLAVDIESPKSPTNLDSFNLNFVALDVLNRAITVRCYKKTPSDAAFSQFGTVGLAAPGGTANCSVTSSILSAEGTYQFYVTASANGDTVTSQTVSVDYKTEGPGTPTDYSKGKVGCDYKIHFKTADDGGRTSKVELYRSDKTSFTADAGTRVGTIVIGSNQEHEFSNGAPDCQKEYYYAVRAFDSAGNGSGIIGDSFTTITTPTVVTETVVGAQPVSGVTLGAAAAEAEAEAEAAEASPEVSPGVEGAQVLGVSQNRLISWLIYGLVFIVILGLLYVLLRKKKTTV